MFHEPASTFSARGLAKRLEGVEARRAQVAILRLCRPGMSAEDVARTLKCSPSTIRGDWRALALRTRSLQVASSTDGAAAVSVEGDEGL